MTTVFGSRPSSMLYGLGLEIAGAGFFLVGFVM